MLTGAPYNGGMANENTPREMTHREIMAMTPAARVEWRAEVERIASAVYAAQQGVDHSAYAEQTTEQRAAQDREQAAEMASHSLAARSFLAQGPTAMEDPRAHEEH